MCDDVALSYKIDHSIIPHIRKIARYRRGLESRSGSDLKSGWGYALAINVGVDKAFKKREVFLVLASHSHSFFLSESLVSLSDNHYSERNLMGQDIYGHKIRSPLKSRDNLTLGGCIFPLRVVEYILTNYALLYWRLLYGERKHSKSQAS